MTVSSAGMSSLKSFHSMSCHEDLYNFKEPISVSPDIDTHIADESYDCARDDREDSKV